MSAGRLFRAADVICVLCVDYGGAFDECRQCVQWLHVLVLRCRESQVILQWRSSSF